MLDSTPDLFAQYVYCEAVRDSWEKFETQPDTPKTVRSDRAGTARKNNQRTLPVVPLHAPKPEGLDLETQLQHFGIV